MALLSTLAFVLLAAQAPAVAEEPPVDKTVCKRIDQGSTGSHIGGPRKVCKKASEWRFEEEQTRRAMRAVRDRAGVNPNNAGGRQ